MNKQLLGQILATVGTAAVDAAIVAMDPQGALSNPKELGEILTGFLQIWLSHPASGLPQAQAPLLVKS